MLARLALLFLLFAAAPAGAAGFQRVTLADAEEPVDLAIWYPADAPGLEQPLGPFRQRVATDAAPRGDALPLLLMSHGSAGSLAWNHDTALALAEAGFVVAALTHPGDNAEDATRSFTAAALAMRPRQLKAALDWLLGQWPHRARLDPRRIAGYGFAEGGFAMLVLAGGEPDLGRIALHCRRQPADPSCRLYGGVTAGPPAWVRDDRLRALVLASPALGYSFVPNGLATLSQPVQIWHSRFDEVMLHPWHAEQIRYALPNPPLHAEVQGAGHYAFLAPCPPPLLASLPETCIDPPNFDRAQFHREYNAAILAFLRGALR